MLIMEFALGQKMQGGPVKAFAKIHPKLSFIGVGSTFVSFIVTTYYTVVMAWSLLFVYYSFTLAWGNDPKTFFFQDVLNLNAQVGEVGAVQLYPFIAFVIVWVLVYFSVWRGVKSLGKAGEIKEVKEGYGQNFLIGKGLAKLATPDVIKQYEANKKKKVESIKR